MTWVRVLYGIGVVCAALVGFCSPIWFSGFAPLAAGLIWAAYDLTDVEAVGVKPPTKPRR